MSKIYKSYDEDFKKTLVSLYESGKNLSNLSIRFLLSLFTGILPLFL